MCKKLLIINACGHRTVNVVHCPSRGLYTDIIPQSCLRKVTASEPEQKNKGGKCLDCLLRAIRKSYRHSAMDNSPLGRLPGEVRNLVYEHAIRHWEPFELSLTPHHTGHRYLRQPWWADTPRHCIAHSATCRQLRRESRAMFFALNDFEICNIAPQELTLCLATFQADIVRLPANQKIRSITVVMRDYDIPRQLNDSDVFVRQLLDSLRALLLCRRYNFVTDKLGLNCAVSYDDDRRRVRVLRMKFDMADLAGSWQAVIAGIDLELARRPFQRQLRTMKHHLAREKGNFERLLGFDASRPAQRW